MEDPTIVVTKIKNRWHSRLYYKGKVMDEMACQLRIDIGYICRTMMRWFDKTGGMSLHAKASRRRLNEPGTTLYGKIWYYNQLKIGRQHD